LKLDQEAQELANLTATDVLATVDLPQGGDKHEFLRKIRKVATLPSQCSPTGAFVHDRVPSSRYKGSPVSEFQEILFLSMVCTAKVDETG
jgi:hypothetical protein